MLEVEAAEDRKTLAGVESVLAFLAESGCNRGTRVVAIGGGIVQDLVSFAAHIFFRGLEWVFVPTTLLAMADSCIGAKSTINFRQVKNQLGAFHAPSRVLLCLRFVETLSDSDVSSGYGEILKLSLTAPRPFFDRVVKSLDGSSTRARALGSLVRASLLTKKRIIEADEYESGPRLVLNYGHTFGHAIETATRYSVPHGVAVAWGLDLANHIAHARGLLSREVRDAVHAVVRRHFVAREIEFLTASELIQLIRRDKKSAGGSVRLILLERPGLLRIESVRVDEALESMISSSLQALQAGT